MGITRLESSLKFRGGRGREKFAGSKGGASGRVDSQVRLSITIRELAIGIPSCANGDMGVLISFRSLLWISGCRTRSREAKVCVLADASSEEFCGLRVSNPGGRLELLASNENQSPLTRTN